MATRKEEEVDGSPVPVWISDVDWAKMIAYCRSSKPNEIMGMAYVREVENGLEVYDPFILKQTVGPASCEFDKADFARFMSVAEDIKHIKCIWHSHVEMSTFFSTCDRGTSEGMAALGRTMGGSSAWFLSIVVNLKQEYQAKVDMYKPMKLTIPAEIKRFATEPTALVDEVKAKVSIHDYTTHHGHDSKVTYIGEDFDPSYFGQHDIPMDRGHRAAWDRYVNDQRLIDKKKPKQDNPEFDSIFDLVEQAADIKIANAQEKKDEGSGKSGT